MTCVHAILRFHFIRKLELFFFDQALHFRFLKPLMRSIQNPAQSVILAVYQLPLDLSSQTLVQIPFIWIILSSHAQRKWPWLSLSCADTHPYLLYLLPRCPRSQRGPAKKMGHRAFVKAFPTPSAGEETMHEACPSKKTMRSHSDVSFSPHVRL